MLSCSKNVLTGQYFNIDNIFPLSKIVIKKKKNTTALQNSEYVTKGEIEVGRECVVCNEPSSVTKILNSFWLNQGSVDNLLERYQQIPAFSVLCSE